MLRDRLAVLALGGPASAAGAGRAARVGRRGRDAGRSSLKAEGTFLPASPPGAARRSGPSRWPSRWRRGSSSPSGSSRSTAGGRAAGRSARCPGGLGDQRRGPAAGLGAPARGGAPGGRARDEAVVVSQPRGPLTRSELELVQGRATRWRWAGSSRPAGGRGRPLDGRRRRRPGLSGYDALAANALEATLESVDADSARVRLRGEIRGAVLGGEGTMACEGTFTLRPQGGPGRPPDAPTGPRPAGRAGRGGARHQEHPDRRAPPGRAPRRAGRRRSLAAARRSNRDPDRELLVLIAPDGKYPCSTTATGTSTGTTPA